MSTRTATTPVALSLFEELQCNLTANLREVAKCLAEAESYLSRAESGEVLSLLHHFCTELRHRIASLDGPITATLERLDGKRPEPIESAT